jgi:hypothetical protein
MRTVAKFFTVSALGLVLVVSHPARADIVKCQAGVEKNVNKLEASAYKALAKCKDGYRKALATNTVVSAGAACQSTLFKAIDFTNPASTIVKIKVALDSLVTKGTCTDTDLRALGHLDTTTFGDRWSKTLAIAAFQTAYDLQVNLVKDFTDILTALGDNGCPLCTKYGKEAPCYKHACVLASGSQIVAYVTGGGLPPVALPGAQLLQFCRDTAIFPGDFAILGTPAKGIPKFAVFGGLADVCLQSIGAEGYVSCAGSGGPGINYSSCQDHVVNPPDSDECPGMLGAGAVCAASSPDPYALHAGITNGGACTKYTTTAAGGGKAFANLTVAFTAITEAADKGADMVSCTEDDTAVPGVPSTTPLTTGSASLQILDGDTTNGNVINAGTVSGLPMNCANVFSSNLAGAKLAGNMSSLHGICPVAPCDEANMPHMGSQPAPQDLAVTFTLVCQ